MVAVAKRVSGLSRASKTLIVGAIIITALGFSGVMRAGNDVPVSRERAVEIATERLDFEHDLTAVKLVREGIDLHPVWAVSFSTKGSGEELYGQVLVVSVDGQTGDIVRVSRE